MSWGLDVDCRPPLDWTMRICWPSDCRSRTGWGVPARGVARACGDAKPTNCCRWVEGLDITADWGNTRILWLAGVVGFGITRIWDICDGETIPALAEITRIWGDLLTWVGGTVRRTTVGCRRRRVNGGAVGPFTSRTTRGGFAVVGGFGSCCRTRTLGALPRCGTTRTLGGGAVSTRAPAEAMGLGGVGRTWRAELRAAGSLWIEPGGTRTGVGTGTTWTTWEVAGGGTT